MIKQTHAWQHSDIHDWRHSTVDGRRLTDVANEFVRGVRLVLAEFARRRAGNTAPPRPRGAQRPPSLEDFIDRHVRPDRQLTLRLALSLRGQAEVHTVPPYRGAWLRENSTAPTAGPITSGGHRTKLHLHDLRQAWRGYQAELSAGEDGDCLRSYLHCCRKLRTASPEPRAGTAIGAGSPSKTILISFCALAIMDINLTDQMNV